MHLVMAKLAVLLTQANLPFQQQEITIFLPTVENPKVIFGTYEHRYETVSSVSRVITLLLDRSVAMFERTATGWRSCYSTGDNLQVSVPEYDWSFNMGRLY